MGCCGNDTGASNYVRWRRGFPTWKHDKSRSIISPSKQSRSQVAVQEAGIHTCWYTRWCASVTLDLMSRCEWRKRNFDEIQFEWPGRPDCRNQFGIAFQTTSECGSDLICKSYISCVCLLSKLLVCENLLGNKPGPDSGPGLLSIFGVTIGQRLNQVVYAKLQL